MIIIKKFFATLSMLYIFAYSVLAADSTSNGASNVSPGLLAGIAVVGAAYISNKIKKSRDRKRAAISAQDNIPKSAYGVHKKKKKKSRRK